MSEQFPDERVSFLGRRLPAGYDLRVVVIAPVGTRQYDHAEWRDSIAMVEQGVIRLECRNGASVSFGPGDLLWLAGLPLRALHNDEHEPAVMAVVTRTWIAGGAPPLSF